jgi:hypothetical protein
MPFKKNIIYIFINYLYVAGNLYLYNICTAEPSRMSINIFGSGTRT